METKIFDQSHPMRQQLDFVLKARGIDPDRPHLNMLHAEGENLVCTDGWRLHKFTGDHCIEDGDYLIISATGKQIVLTLCSDYSFPDWKRVMPNKAEYKEVPEVMDMHEASLKKKEVHELSKKYFAFIKQTACLVDLNFFSDLTGRSWTVFFKGKHDSVLFEDGEYTALIMPMSTEY